MKKIFSVFSVALAVTAAALLLLPGKETPAAAEYAKGLIRFHVIANSDSLEDQSLKLAVRDAVVNVMRPVLDGAADAGEAGERVDASLDLIAAAAAGVVEKNGYTYPVRVMHGNYVFPQKTYLIKNRDEKTTELALPAGDYEAVRVIIGSGRGANWWCVLFPPLCFVNAVEQKISDNETSRNDAAAMPAAGLEKTNGLNDMNMVEYRIKLADWFKQ